LGERLRQRGTRATFAILLAFAIAAPTASAHAAGARPQNSNLLGPRYEFGTQLTTPGIYPYHCGTHPSMRGEVVVLYSPPGNESRIHQVEIRDGGNESRLDELRYVDAASGTNVTTIPPGDWVNWRNVGNFTYDVEWDAPLNLTAAPPASTPTTSTPGPGIGPPLLMIFAASAWSGCRRRPRSGDVPSSIRSNAYPTGCT
jgi:plastocyanin